MTDSAQLAIIGGGNMGGALLTGLLEAGWVAPESLAVAEVDQARRAALETRHPDVAVTSAVPSCRAAVIAVKPPDVPAAGAAAAGAGAQRLLSIAAGVTIGTLEQAAGAGVAVIRAMPNTPALVGAGVSAVAPGTSADEEDLAWAEEILGAVGTTVRVPERALDAVTGVSGSGPAYLFLVAEALIDAGVLVGLTRDTARVLVTQLFVGSAALLSDRQELPEVLRAAVTSPAGTTAAGLHVLEDRAVRAAFAAAVVAATDRSRELGTEPG